MTIKLIRMSSGEDVVANVIREDDDSYLFVKDPIVAVAAGNNQLGFAPWSPIANEDVESIGVDRKFIVFITDPKDEVIEHYNKLFNLVIVPNNKIIV